ncbi:hypothetical protein L3Y34_017717 [Caenorhabditis briggsae]|uniref:Uncharacterized protein n=1 Tax=Caenorhabditis briggsae TaxID=6238 RepID=A0AAE9IU05_CAEBR|nr:hypothetical protein L3Y34_017717 [Caenorhabditis briggsae]
MNRFILAAFLLVAIFAVSLASVAQQKVKNGDRFELRLFNGALAISRTVPAEKQVFNFIGEHKGYFVDENGKKIESSNYEIQNGILVIKKFTDADVGLYSKHPNEKIMTTNDDGTISAVPGRTLRISLE